MKSLNTLASFLLAICFNTWLTLTDIVLCQTTTFVRNNTIYSITLQQKFEQNRIFTLSYEQSDGNTHQTAYRGSCNSNIIDVLGENIINSEGRVIYQEIAKQSVMFDISPNSNWELSNTIRQALGLICQ